MPLYLMVCMSIDAVEDVDPLTPKFPCIPISQKLGDRKLPEYFNFIGVVDLSEAFNVFDALLILLFLTIVSYNECNVGVWRYWICLREFAYNQ